MDSVELMPMLRNILQSVSLDELKRIPGLRSDIHPHDLPEPSPVITHTSTTSPAEQVQKPRFQ